ncbi:MAG TPA: alkaline phosphatase family protein [Terriglobales bacterium]|nr:alkaline phosphatase family protein [Terriglobales bacterium]
MRRFLLPLFLSSLSLSAVCAPVPAAGHVVVVMEENHSYSSVIGKSSMPYGNALANQCGLATQFYANTHPSIGNYFMMTTGQIVTNSDGYGGTFSGDNIVRHLMLAGKTWKVYAESLPYAGYTGGDQYPYIKHHNPFAYFSDVVNSSNQRPFIVPFTQFAADLANGTLPDFSFVVPNQLHNAHDGSLSAADAWLKAQVAPLLANAQFQKDGLLVIAFDESYSSDTAHGGGHIATVVVSPKYGKRGYRSTSFYQHQNLLRTFLEALGLNPQLGAAASARSMAEFFTTTGTPPPPTTAGCTLSTVNNTVTICSPANNGTSSSPVRVVAGATSSEGVRILQIYIDGAKTYQVSGGRLDTSLPLSTGTHRVSVQAYTMAGSVFKATVYTTVK